MPRQPSKRQLFDHVTDAVEASGWRYIVHSAAHPFRLRVFQDDGRRNDLLIYVWNCTHGGGAARPSDEFRIQLTGVVPDVDADSQTLLLGWHGEYGVFAAFDIRRHTGQTSASPSIQVSRDALLNANTHTFAAHRRGNGEIVIAFQPEYLMDYVENASKLHGEVGAVARARALLSEVDTATEEAIAEIRDKTRRDVIATIKKKFREHDFRNRVLTAYGQRCAVCGIQLRLIEAAHILPVVVDNSTDETTNGIALCALHHRALDSNLLSFDERYEVEVSEAAVERLSDRMLAGGLGKFRQGLRRALILPADRRDFPNPEYIRVGRRARGWM